MMTLLEGLRDSLAGIAGVASCRIGLEANITPDDYPLIRIVPSRMQDAAVLGQREAELLIYFGMPVHPFEDEPDASGRTAMEKLYAALYTLEAQILTRLATFGGLYRETIADEDRLETYKLMAIRCEVKG
jgi:hypothetical protein